MPIRIIEEASVPNERGGKVRIIERAASPQATPDQMRAFAGRGRKPVSGPMDMLKGGVSGLYGSLASMAPPVFADGPLRAVRQAADLVAAVQDMRAGKRPQVHPSETAAPASPLANLMIKAAGQDYTPETRGGRWAKTAGSMLPAVVVPGTMIQRGINVVAPTIGAEGAAEAVGALGGDENAQEMARMVGGFAGGLAGNVRPVARPNSMPREDALAMRYVDKMAGNAPLDQVKAAPQEMFGAEALGQSGKRALGSLARREGATGEALNAEVSGRQLGRPGRLLDAFASVTGVHPDAAAGDLQKLVDVGRVKAAPLYEEAYAAGGVDTPKLRSLSGRPSVKAALKKAIGIAAEEDIQPHELGFEVSTSGDGAEVVKITNPTAKTWDYVKRGLDDVMEGYRDKTTGKLVLDEKGRATLGTLKALREELIDANPAYGRALETSGDYLSSEAAFRDAGKDIFNSNLTERQFAERFARMSESSREAYKGGIANRFHDLAQNSRLDPKVLKTPRVRVKLQMALGNDEADRLIELAGHEGDMLAFERRYAPGAGSITSEMAAGQAEQDAMSGKGAEIINDVLRTGPKRAIGAQLGAAMEALGPTRGMPVGARDKAGQALMMSPAELAAAIQRYRDAQPKGLPQLKFAPDPRLVSLLTGDR